MTGEVDTATVVGAVLFCVLILVMFLVGRGNGWRERYCTEALTHAATGADSVVIYQDVPKCLKGD